MIGFDCVCVYVCVCVCERESERERERDRETERERERISYLILFHWFVIYLIHFSDILYNFISLICLVYLTYISMTYFYFSSLSTFFFWITLQCMAEKHCKFSQRWKQCHVVLCYFVLYVTVCYVMQPIHLNTLALTESTLSRYNRTGDIWKGGPYPHYESINGQNRSVPVQRFYQRQ